MEQLEDRIEDLEDVIEESGDHMEDILGELEDMEDLADEDDGPRIHVEGEPVDDREWSDYLEETVDRLNGLLQKGFKKVADTLENIDFEQVGENVQTAAAKAAKTVGGVASDAAKTVSGVASDAAKTVENAWTEARENHQKPGGIGDCHISGSSVIDGG